MTVKSTADFADSCSFLVCVATARSQNKPMLLSWSTKLASVDKANRNWLPRQRPVGDRKNQTLRLTATTNLKRTERVVTKTNSKPFLAPPFSHPQYNLVFWLTTPNTNGSGGPSRWSGFIPHRHTAFFAHEKYRQSLDMLLGPQGKLKVLPQIPSWI